MKRLLLLALLPACLRDPVPALEPPTGVDVGNTGGGNIVYGEFFTWEFSDEGDHFPVSLMLRDRNLDATEMLPLRDNDNCAGERGVGLAVYPSTLLSGDGTPNGSTIEETQIGPAVVQLRLGWNQTLPGEDCVATTSGESLFTFFPDGHMHRWDHLEVHAATPQLVNNCRCNMDAVGNSLLTSYFTLANNEVTGVRTPAELIMPPLNPGAQTPSDERTVCALGHDGRAIAFTFPQGRQRFRRPLLTSLAFVHDLTTPTDMIITDVQEAATDVVVYFNTESCDEPLGDAGLLADAPPLDTDELPASFTVDPMTGFYRVGTDMLPSKLTLAPFATIPAGFVVLLEYNAPTEVIVDLPRDQYLLQPYLEVDHASDRRFLIWFRDRLDPGSRIVITSHRNG